MSYHGQEVDRAFSGAIARLFAEGPARHAVLSNCDERRFDELAAIFPETPLLRGYITSSGTVLRVRTGSRDTHPPELLRATLAAGKMLRKPSRRLIDMALDHFGVRPDRAAIVGDQYLTDIASGNMAGIVSVRVKPLKTDTFPMRFRISQRIEQALFRLRHPGSWVRPVPRVDEGEAADEGLRHS